MSNDLTHTPPVTPEPRGPGDSGPAIGQWYWVKEKKEKRWLGCVMEIGSNYVLLESPHSEYYSYNSQRVHFDDFEKTLTFAADAETYIAQQQAYHKQRISELMGDVQALTARLGVMPSDKLAAPTSNALTVVSGKANVHAYKNALIKAADKTLPELFEEIKSENHALAKWMMASSMPLMASVGPLKKSISAVKDRIHTIELYAGLTEEAVLCKDGVPAPAHEKLHVMQRRLYMDEECLANYQAGGMEFKDIEAFDKWISKPANLKCMLPFPRTLAAFRVRRNEKEREHDGNIWRAMVNFHLADADKKTFFYVRNGERVWRVDCDFEFDESIVPDENQFNPSTPMMVSMRYGRIESMISRQSWEALYKEQEAQRRKYDAWEKTHPGESWINNPYHNTIGFYNQAEEYGPLDPSNVYFDDASAEISADIKRYNRVAVIVQGLFDRSAVLHPHPPVKVWDPESFEKSVCIVYDAKTLTHGDKPDFEAYRAKLNASMDGLSIVTGQHDYWAKKEAQKENERINKDYRYKGTHPHYKRFQPYGDKGPMDVGPISKWKARSRRALFRWERESRMFRRHSYNMIGVSLEVPIEHLLNVTAYQPGDFKQFYADPRTRADYLRWAPLLLAAEDYHAGKVRKWS